MGRSILVASGNGGCGKTTFSIAMAISLARQGYRVCILDLNFGLRNDDIYLGLEDKVLYDIGDIFSGICKVEKALIKADSSYGDLYLLEATQNKIVKGISEGHVRALIKQLKEEFDYVVIDSAASVGENIDLVVGGSDTAVLVLTPDPLSLRNCDAVDKRLANSRVRSRCFVLNMVRHSLEEGAFGPTIDEITKILSIPMAGIIPYDENIQLGNSIGRPVFAETGSYISKNIDDIVGRMLG